MTTCLRHVAGTCTMCDVVGQCSTVTCVLCAVRLRLQCSSPGRPWPAWMITLRSTIEASSLFGLRLCASEVGTLYPHHPTLFRLHHALTDTLFQRLLVIPITALPYVLSPAPTIADAVSSCCSYAGNLQECEKRNCECVIDMLVKLITSPGSGMWHL